MAFDVLKIYISINQNAQYLQWCTKIQEIYLLIKMIILSILKVISKVVERHRKPLHRSMGTPLNIKQAAHDTPPLDSGCGHPSLSNQ